MDNNSEDIKYFCCPPFNGDRITVVHSEIKRWIKSRALSNLITLFKSKFPSQNDLTQLVEWLLEFSEKWDFRGRLHKSQASKDITEGARWQLDDSEFTDEDSSLILNSARQLGLVETREPSEKQYSYILVLGGARLSCLLRPRLAAEIIKKNNIKTRAVVLLASGRPVTDSERIATDTYAPGAKDEFALMNAGAEQSFGVDARFDQDQWTDPANPNKNWAIRRYGNNSFQFPNVVSLSAPSSEPGKRRANSMDTYKFFMENFDIDTGDSLLLVTSQIYVPYQQLEAIRTLALPNNILVETIGFPPVWGGDLQGMTGPTNYLQEIRSTIQSVHRFLDAYPVKD